MPNEKHPCSLIDYPTCVMNSITKKIQNSDNCIIPPTKKHDEMLDYCPNTIALKAIKELKKALKQDEYDNCKDIKLCNDVQFKAREIEVPVRQTPFTGFLFQYDGFIVEHLEDSYVYSFLTIFSEIGGSLGILVGLSCITIVDFLIDLYKRI